MKKSSVFNHILIGLLLSGGILGNIWTTSVSAASFTTSVRFYSNKDNNPAQTLRENLQESDPDKRFNGSFAYLTWLPEQTKISSSGQASKSLLDQIQTLDSEEPEIRGEALFFPNPFRQDEGAELGFDLSRDTDIELIIYDMRANVIHRASAEARGIGGSEGYNRVATKSTIKQGNGSRVGVVGFRLDELPRLPSGPYFFVLLHEKKVLQKGKFVVLP